MSDFCFKLSRWQPDYYITFDLVCQEVFETFLKFFSTGWFARSQRPFYYITSELVCQVVFSNFFEVFSNSLAAGSLRPFYYTTSSLACQVVFESFFQNLSFDPPDLRSRLKPVYYTIPRPLCQGGLQSFFEVFRIFSRTHPTASEKPRNPSAEIGAFIQL